MLRNTVAIIYYVKKYGCFIYFLIQWQTFLQYFLVNSTLKLLESWIHGHTDVLPVSKRLIKRVLQNENLSR